MERLHAFWSLCDNANGRRVVETLLSQNDDTNNKKSLGIPHRELIGVCRMNATSRMTITIRVRCAAAAAAAAVVVL